MSPPTPRSLNFDFLAPHGAMLVLLGAQAERYFADDPATCLFKLRLLAELLAKEAAAHCGLYVDERDQLVDTLRRLRDRGALPKETDDIFRSVRQSGNAAVHANKGTQSEALHQLKLVRHLAIWFHRSFGPSRTFQAPAFVPPRPPADATAEVLAEVERLRAAVTEADAARLAAQEAAKSADFARMSAEQRAEAERADKDALEALLDEAAKQQAAMVDRLAAIQREASAAPANDIQAFVDNAVAAASSIELDEADTRKLIDQQLRAVGWEADTSTLRWSAGARPQKGKNLAIAEVPTDDGIADYALYCGLTPVGVVEAKRKAKDVAGSIEQAKRYARAFRMSDAPDARGPWGKYRVPFLFATNGRPFLKQIETKSGIWFLDGRRAQNHARALDGWPSPEGLFERLDRDVDVAQSKLETESTEYLGLRDYQVRAIKSVEAAIAKGQREILLAMATGTGKTKTCIGLCYRLLKTDRFRRILFLVDRSALGIQATNAFKEARLENLLTFDSIYGMKSLGEGRPDAETRFQVSTVQAMVNRIVYTEGDVPPVDEYDCIVIDECHRGYLLDREMSEGELSFRSEADYFSKYRRVLEHFDAVKIGLTATPALQTHEIFGDPVYTYSYREAVVDGYLVDHEPPTRIVTALAEDGIHWRVGETVETYERLAEGTQLSLLPDDVDVDVEQFNKRVRTENFNRVVCEALANHIDPAQPEKTLVFCVTDEHADLVVKLLKEAFEKAYGAVDDDAVLKITGTSDKPLELIRRYKNEQLPNVAVTVDLLTTGIDVERICNLVFLRRVRSRILYDQMLGRATRLCPDIGKEVFHIYDAVDLYKDLAPYSDMKPVVTDVSIDFGTLIDELVNVPDATHREDVLAQLLAKLQRKSKKLRDAALDEFETAAGMTPDELLAFLRKSGPDVARKWFAEHPDLGEVLDAKRTGTGQRILISTHGDEVRRIERGYGEGQERPQDFLEGFAAYVRSHMNDIPAMLIVTQRPRELTRKQLKELELELSKAGYTSAHLRAAWRDATNHDIAASIIGFIRQAALGDALTPYDVRVSRALYAILASRAWTKPQQSWLKRIAKQLQQEVVVDHDALNRGQFAAEGGFEQINKRFEGKLDAVLGDFADEIWRAGS